MIRSKEIAFVTALTVGGLAGCTSEAPAPADASYTYTTPSGDPTIASEMPLPPVANHTASLMLKNAGINLIFVPVKHKGIPTGENIYTAADEAEQLAKLLHGTPEYRKDVLRVLANATHNRYKPKKIHLEKAGGISLKECVDSDNASQIDAIQTAAQPFMKYNEENVIIVDQRGCDLQTGPGQIAGFAYNDQAPILTSGSLTSFSNVITHELGHSAGLAHAGTVDCKDVVKVNDCKTDEVADPNSIMSYVGGRDAYDFTATDLVKMGLLKPSEALIDPASGEYTLATTDAKGLKVLQFNNASNPIYISVEVENGAAYDTRCIVGRKLPKGVSVSDEYSIGDHYDAKLHKRVDDICYIVHKRPTDVTVQIREDLGNTMALVERKHTFADSKITSVPLGEYTPNTVLYESPALTIILKQFKNRNEAVIEVVQHTDYK